MNTSLVIDSHVHLYPNFNLETAFTSGLNNLRRWGGKAPSVYALLLTERSDCNLFDQLAQKQNIGPFKIVTGAGFLRLQSMNQPELLLLPGRQIVSSEALEVCSLANTFFAPDRIYTCLELIKQIQAAGGVPALNWAPGKWLFKRSQVVRHLIDTVDPHSALIGDTSMRPVFWPTPTLMAYARKLGWRFVAGSDPLPFSGEENLLGRYACKLETEWDNAKPAESIRSSLLNPAAAITAIGRRSATFEFFGRQIRIMKEKGTRP
jgi:hypothetical protein